MLGSADIDVWRKRGRFGQVDARQAHAAAAARGLDQGLGFGQRQVGHERGCALQLDAAHAGPCAHARAAPWQAWTTSAVGSSTTTVCARLQTGATFQLPHLCTRLHRAEIPNDFASTDNDRIEFWKSITVRCTL